MAYMSMSTWDWSNITGDEPEVRARIAENIGKLKEAGAEQVFVARLGPDEAIAVSIYPDQATRERVREMLLPLRDKSSKDFSVRVTHEAAGEVLLSV